MENFIDTAIATGIVGVGGVIQTLDSIPLGSTNSTRQGNQVFLEDVSLQIAFQLDSQTVSDPHGDLLRMIMFVDRQSQTAFTVATLLQTVDVTAFPNWDQTGRFEIIYDKTIAVNPMTQNGVLGSSQTTLKHQCSAEIFMNQHYNGSTTTVESNQLNLLLITLNGLVTVLDGFTRLVYIDY